jgi:hypothetical protein
MHEHAQVLQLESQLTVPTRNRTHLSDVWVAIASGTHLTLWAEALQRVADSYDTRRSGTGTMQLVRMSDQRGWIVARGVDLRLCSPSDVEETVRDLITLANRAAGAQVTNSPAAPSATKWAYRIRSALWAGGNTAMIVAAPPRGTKIEASSAG